MGSACDSVFTVEDQRDICVGGIKGQGIRPLRTGAVNDQIFDFDLHRRCRSDMKFIQRGGTGNGNHLVRINVSFVLSVSVADH